MPMPVGCADGGRSAMSDRGISEPRALENIASLHGATTRRHLGRRNSMDYWPRRAMGATNRPPLCFHLGLLNAAISLFALRGSNRTCAPSVKAPGSPIISPASTGSMVAKSIVQLGKDRSEMGSRLIVITWVCRLSTNTRAYAQSTLCASPSST